MDKEKQKEIELVAEVMANKFFSNKPDWFEEHEKADDKRFGENDVQNKEILKRIDELTKIQKKYHDKSEPMLEWFEQMTWGKKSRIQWLKVTGMIVGVVTGCMTILAGIWLAFKFAITQVK